MLSFYYPLFGALRRDWFSKFHMKSIKLNGNINCFNKRSAIKNKISFLSYRRLKKGFIELQKNVLVLNF